MNRFSFFRASTVRLFFWFGMAVLFTGLGVWSILACSTWVAPTISGSVAASVVILASIRFWQYQIRLLRWEVELTQLALDHQRDGNRSGNFPETETLNPFRLSSSSGKELADFGWNLLVDAGRRWGAYTELQQSLTKSMSGDRRQSGISLMELLPDGIVAIDHDQRICYANQAFASICRRDQAKELIGSNLAEALQVDAETAARLNQNSRGIESSVEWKDGEGARTFVGYCRPGRKNDGLGIAVVWTFRDVTQQRLAELMRDQFLATATHELRTPLANIRAYAESLETGDEIDIETQKKFFNVIQSESTRLSQLVDNLLDISQMQAGALTLDSHETDLGRLAEDVAQKVQAEMTAKKIDFRREFPPKFPKVLVDKAKLTAALVNLLGNAAKYTPEGGRVTFRIEISAQKVKFIVSDTGIGIDPEEQSKIFDRFFRSADERVRDVTGSGLGLALSQEVARLHGGEIRLTSALNQGSSFCLDIPFETVAV